MIASGFETPRVFPAHAGMSLTALGLTGKSVSFPRTRGDEPDLHKGVSEVGEFSPHTRG